ncbi:DUF4328 domain-containing protein [Streptomyces sp. NPDC017979]|uniref:DUF4328 domain-containing protein n=1 Tax=Streptomyces sp. NPDC017979 TaxID=3365024 RepID=UPI0037906237
MNVCSVCRATPAVTPNGLCAGCAAAQGAVPPGAAQQGPPPPPMAPGQPAPAGAPGYPAPGQPQPAGFGAPPPYPAAPGPYPAAPGPYPGGPAPYGGPTPYPAGPAPYPAAPPVGMPYAPVPLAVKVPVGLSYAVMALLGAVIATDLFSIGAAVNVSTLMADLEQSPFSVSADTLDRADGLMALAGVLQVVAYLATAVVFVIWFFKARANADAFAPDIPRMQRGWAIGGWFIPFANLVIPRKVAGDIWAASRRNPYGGHKEQPERLLNFWWGFWVLSLIVARVSVMRYDKAESPEEVGSAAFGLVFSDLADIVAAVLAILVVRAITRMQSEKVSLPHPPPAPAFH